MRTGLGFRGHMPVNSLTSFFERWMKLPSNHRLSIRLYIWQSAFQNYAAANCLVFLQFVQCAHQRADITCRICRCHLPNLPGKLRFSALRPRFMQCSVLRRAGSARRLRSSSLLEANLKGNVLAVLNLNNGAAMETSAPR
jgi:hypothetical protein